MSDLHPEGPTAPTPSPAAARVSSDTTAKASTDEAGNGARQRGGADEAVSRPSAEPERGTTVPMNAVDAVPAVVAVEPATPVVVRAPGAEPVSVVAPAGVEVVAPPETDVVVPAGTDVVVPAGAVVAEAVQDPEAPTVVSPRKRRWWWPFGGPKPRIEWRSFSGWFALLWMIDLAWLGLMLYKGAPAVPPGAEGMARLPLTWLGKVAGACGLSVLLSFIVPIAMLDDSSHHTRGWWVAWLWPAVMALMLAADSLGVAAAYMRIKPLVEALKH